RNLSCGGMSPVWHQDLSSRAARTTFGPPSVERSLPGRRIEKTAVRDGKDEIALIRIGYRSVNHVFPMSSSTTYALRLEVAPTNHRVSHSSGDTPSPKTQSQLDSQFTTILSPGSLGHPDCAILFKAIRLPN